MSDNIKSKVLSKIDSSPVFALQLDESTDIFNLSQLLVYVRYVADKRINEEFLFCQPLETTSKAVDVFQMLIDFFDKTELSWSKLVGVCTDGAPAMIGANSGLISLVKLKNPAIQGIHCMIHKAALVSKTIPKRLHKHMSVVIKVVNYVKSLALNTRLLSQHSTQNSASFVKIWMPIILRFYTRLKFAGCQKGTCSLRRSQVVFSCKTKTRSFVGIWWRQIFYILSLPC